MRGHITTTEDHLLCHWWSRYASSLIFVNCMTSCPISILHSTVGHSACAKWERSLFRLPLEAPTPNWLFETTRSETLQPFRPWSPFTAVARSEFYPATVAHLYASSRYYHMEISLRIGRVQGITLETRSVMLLWPGIGLNNFSRMIIWSRGTLVSIRGINSKCLNARRHCVRARSISYGRSSQSCLLQWSRSVPIYVSNKAYVSTT